MSAEQEDDKESQLLDAYSRIIREPLYEKYEDKWEEETYWQAVETFKVASKEIGYDDPFEVLGEYYRYTSFEAIRNILKAGPKPCFREGWRSPYTGEKVDILALVQKLHHAGGPKFEGKERIVILDYWATWCGPCLMVAPALSELFEKHARYVAVIGLANDDMFNKKKEHNPETIKTFLENHKESFRFSSYIDNEDHLARD
ncbi:Thioredoxin-2, partial [Gryganskiella cystojenkinii]